MIMNKGAVVGLVVLALVIIAGAYLITQNQAALGSNANAAVISLTDPPHVPNGTTSLMISYSSVEAHVVNASSSGWVSIQGSGSVDLLSLVNVSQVIANSKIAANSTINMVRFTVSSANITINGVTSNVTVPSGMITANVSNSGNSTSQVLMDFTPSIVAIYTNSSTVFVMVPSVRAVAFSGNHGQVSIGARAQLNSSEKADIRSTANISIMNETVMTSGNSSIVRVTVKNNGNSSVTIKHIMINGNMQVLVAPFANVDSSANANDSINRENSSQKVDVKVNSNRKPDFAGITGGSVGQSFGINSGNGNINSGNYSIGITNGNITINGNVVGNLSSLSNTVHIVAGHIVRIGTLLVNGSAITSGNISINGSVVNMGNIVNINNGEIEIDGRNTGVRISGVGSQEAANLEGDVSSRVKTFTTLGVEIKDLREVTFAVSSNGTLVLPRSDRSESSANGYTLAPGAEETFTFSGVMSAGSGHVLMNFVPGSNYSVYVQGEDGAHARANVTAS